MPRLNRESDRTNITPVVEPLEHRQLLSASLAGQFMGNVPSELLAGKLNNRVTVQVSNTSGARESGKVSVGLYVSTTPDLQGDTVLVGTAARNLTMRPGQAANFPFRFASPSSMPDGSDYLVAKIDAPSVLGASSGESMVVAPQPVSIVHPFVDLTGQATGPASPIIETGVRAARGSMRVVVTNIGSAPAKGTMQIAADISLESTFDGSAIGIGSVTVPGVTIKPGASRAFVVPLTIPANTPGGSYTLFANINAAHRIAESDFANDVVTANGPLVLFSPTTTLGAGGGIESGGTASGGGDVTVNINAPKVTIVNNGGHHTIIRGINAGGSTGSNPPCAGGPGNDSSGDNGSGGDTSGGDTGGSGSSCGGDDSGANNSGGNDPGCDNSGADDSGGDSSGSDTSGGDTSDNGTAGGDTSGGDTSGTDSSGSDTSGGDSSGSDTPGTDGSGGDTSGPTDPGNGADPSNSDGSNADPGTDPTDPGNGSDSSATGGTTDGSDGGGNGTDPGADPGTDSGSGTDAGDTGATDSSGGDNSGYSSGSDFTGDDGSDSGGGTDFATVAFKRSPPVRHSQPSGPVRIAFGRIR